MIPRGRRLPLPRVLLVHTRIINGGLHENHSMEYQDTEAFRHSSPKKDEPGKSGTSNRTSTGKLSFPSPKSSPMKRWLFMGLDLYRIVSLPNLGFLLPERQEYYSVKSKIYKRLTLRLWFYWSRTSVYVPMTKAWPMVQFTLTKCSKAMKAQAPST